MAGCCDDDGPVLVSVCLPEVQGLEPEDGALLDHLVECHDDRCLVSISRHMAALSIHLRSPIAGDLAHGDEGEGPESGGPCNPLLLPFPGAPMFVDHLPRGPNLDRPLDTSGIGQIAFPNLDALRRDAHRLASLNSGVQSQGTSRDEGSAGVNAGPCFAPASYPILVEGAMLPTRRAEPHKR